MPARYPKPFFRNGQNCWYVQLGKKQIRLSPDKDEAFRLYHELMQKPPEEREAPTGSLAVNILDAFLDWCQRNQEPRTYDFHKSNLTTFARSLPRGISVSGLKPYHVTRCMDAQETWGNSTKHGFCRSVCRAFNWAVKQGHLEKSPVKGVEKPPQERREDVIAPEEFERILAMFPDQAFRDLLITVWETGCRPQEAFAVEKKHFDEQGKRWVFAVKDSKGKRKSRVVYLSDKAVEITKRLAELHPTGKMLRNRDGAPWDKNCVNRRFLRKKKKIGRKVCLYTIRHSFCQRMLIAGVDTLTVSLLMGHASTKMIMEHYQHLHASPEHFAKALNVEAAPVAEPPRASASPGQKSAEPSTRQSPLPGLG